jgi:ATP adenylyltransferase/5',5'''-P-1,P-4-tetraphosphate phosphorylase II
VSVEIALPHSIHPLPVSVTSTSPSEVPTSSLSAFFADLLSSSAIPKEGSYNLILDRATVTIVRRSKEDAKLGGGLALIR